MLSRVGAQYHRTGLRKTSIAIRMPCEDLPLVILQIFLGIRKWRTSVRLENTHDLVDLVRVPGLGRQLVTVVIELHTARAREDEDLDRIIVRRLKDTTWRSEGRW